MNNRTVVHGAYAKYLHIGFCTPLKPKEKSILSRCLDAAL
jgi:hypothetical protein